MWRIADEAAGMEDGEDGHSVWYGALQAVRDPKVYMLILLQFSLLVGMAYVSQDVLALDYGKLTKITDVLLSVDCQYFGI